MSTILKKSLKVIESYVVLKYRAWEIESELKKLKEPFYYSVSEYSEAFLVEPKELGGVVACVSPVDRKLWDYPEEIRILEAKLKAKKAAYETKAEPLGVDRSYRVTFQPYQFK